MLLKVSFFSFAVTDHYGTCNAKGIKEMEWRNHIISFHYNEKVKCDAQQRYEAIAAYHLSIIEERSSDN